MFQLILTSPYRKWNKVSICLQNKIIWPLISLHKELEGEYIEHICSSGRTTYSPFQHCVGNMVQRYSRLICVAVVCKAAADSIFISCKSSSVYHKTCHRKFEGWKFCDFELLCFSLKSLLKFNYEIQPKIQKILLKMLYYFVTVKFPNSISGCSFITAPLPPHSLTAAELLSKWIIDKIFGLIVAWEKRLMQNHNGSQLRCFLSFEPSLPKKKQ